METLKSLEAVFGFTSTMLFCILMCILLLAILCFAAYGILIEHFYEHCPFLFDRKEWRTWKTIRETEFKFKEECEIGYADILKERIYESDKGIYAAVFVKRDGTEICGVFDKESGECIFSDFWKPYTDKLLKRLKECNGANNAV